MFLIPDLFPNVYDSTFNTTTVFLYRLIEFRSLVMIRRLIVNYCFSGAKGHVKIVTGRGIPVGCSWPGLLVLSRPVSSCWISHYFQNGLYYGIDSMLPCMFWILFTWLRWYQSFWRYVPFSLYYQVYSLLQWQSGLACTHGHMLKNALMSKTRNATQPRLRLHLYVTQKHLFTLLLISDTVWSILLVYRLSWLWRIKSWNINILACNNSRVQDFISTSLQFCYHWWPS